MTVVFGILMVLVAAGGMWYAARKLSAAENTAKADSADAAVAKERAVALEKQRAADTEFRKEKDLEEAAAATATANTDDGWNFLLESFKTPR